MTGTPTPRSTRIAYRPDIDGLRAVAVLSVLGYHLRLGTFSGGFIGVDVFFVISGYLISSILLSELDGGRFSLRTFYIRRIRRIFPALVAAMLGTSVLAYLFLMPSELVAFAKSLLAVTFSASNVYFARHTTYFDPRTFDRPVIQTWSLGVEEQFYVVFPLLLWWLHRRFRSRLAAAIIALTALSFVVSVVGAYRFPILAYMMFYTRACELLLGTLLALPLIPAIRSRLTRNLLALLGLAMIAYADHAYNLLMPFPGLAVLLPCGGSALLIWTGQPAFQEVAYDLTGTPSLTTSHPPTIVARLLALRPVVFVGLISYSLYLWHWPIVVFQDMGMLWGAGITPRAAKVLDLLVSLSAATLCWRFVEQPFRSGGLRLTGNRAFTFAAAMMALLTCVAGVALATHGLPGRLPVQAAQVAAYVDEPMNYRMDSCLAELASSFKPDICLREDQSRQNWLLLGDSHAAAMWQGLAQAMPSVNFLQATLASCHPDPAQTTSECGKMMQPIFQDFLATHRVDRILVVCRWTLDDAPLLDRLTEWARARSIPLTIIGPTQEYDAPLPRLLALSIIRHDPGLPARHRSLQSVPFDNFFAQAATNRWHVPYLSLVKMFCQGSECATYVGTPGASAPLMLDGDHFSNEGSVLAGKRIVADQLLGPTPRLDDPAPASTPASPARETL